MFQEYVWVLEQFPRWCSNRCNIGVCVVSICLKFDSLYIQPFLRLYFNLCSMWVMQASPSVAGRVRRYSCFNRCNIIVMRQRRMLQVTRHGCSAIDGLLQRFNRSLAVVASVFCVSFECCKFASDNAAPRPYVARYPRSLLRRLIFHWMFQKSTWHARLSLCPDVGR